MHSTFEETSIIALACGYWYAESQIDGLAAPADEILIAEVAVHQLLASARGNA